MAYLGKGRIAELRYIAKQLGEKVNDDLKIIDLKNLIVNSPNYEEFVREMLNMIIEKRLKTSTSRVSKYFDLNEMYILSTIELKTLLKLKKYNSKTINKVKGKSESVSLNPCIIRSKENEVEMPVLKDTEASLDIGCEKYAAPEMFTGEHASIKHILDNGMACLRPAELEIECGLGHVVSKPVVSPVQLDKEKYNDQFGLGEYLVETEETLVPSLTKEDQYTMNLIKINAYEFIETQQKSKESAPLIQKIENGINNEVRDQEIAPMQLVPVRREIFSKLNVNRVEPLPIIPENKHILSGMSMSLRCHEAVPVPETASTPLVEALPQIFRKVFPREIQADRDTLLMSILTAELLQKLGTYCPLRVPFRLKMLSIVSAC
ncbi:uncharacterized protein TNCV_3218021 [Trichonephila clavipes]|nr:uncharacterized protein TNCV_3218021 [Trichonephila clavipes]